MSLPDPSQENRRKPGHGCASLATLAYKSPALILLIITVTVFAAEALVMALLRQYPLGESWLAEAIGDATLLVLLISPVLYFFLFRPMVTHIDKHQKYEEALDAARARAEGANSAKSRFLAAASHDLRQPLAALELYTAVLKTKASSGDGPVLHEMSECVASLSNLLSKLLDLSKLDAGAVTPQIGDFDMDELFDKLEAAFAPKAATKGLRVRYGYCGLTARTDPVLFQRIVGNLVANAIEYTTDGGVLVACRRRQGKRWVEVWDTGMGIPQDKIGEIFEEFKQLDGAPARGSGLGLTIVARTAELLGLQIRVHSRPGRGSMFAIELPLGEKKRLAAREPARRVRGVRVAVVDDNPAVLKALVRAIESAGNEVVAATTGKDLLARLGTPPPDVIVCDYRLAAGETGIDVIASARKLFGNDLPAVIITGDTDPALMRSVQGKDIVVQHKPIEFEDLEARIAEAMHTYD